MCKLERDDAAEAIDEVAPGFQLYWTPRYEVDWAMGWGGTCNVDRQGRK